MKQSLVLIALSMLCIMVSPATWAQRAGQSVSIQYGVVVAASPVDLKSDAVPKGVIVGGSLGLISASGKSSGKKARNAMIGAIAGGAIGSAGQGNTSGMLYTANLSGGGGQVQVVTDQREIRVGDCVAIEKAGDTANVRRVSAAYCDEANEAAITAVESEAREEAEECLMAKQQLVNAANAEEADLAARKIQLLCDD